MRLSSRNAAFRSQGLTGLHFSWTGHATTHRKPACRLNGSWKICGVSFRPSTFDLACTLFTSFGYFKDEQDDLRVLRNIHQSLKDTGVLVIEVVGKERLARAWQNTISTELADGSLLVQRPQIRDDWCRVYSEWILVKDGCSRSFGFEHTIYSGRELKDRPFELRL